MGQSVFQCGVGHRVSRGVSDRLRGELVGTCDPARPVTPRGTLRTERLFFASVLNPGDPVRPPHTARSSPLPPVKPGKNPFDGLVMTLDADPVQ